jgi:hypothetical protein
MPGDQGPTVLLAGILCLLSWLTLKGEDGQVTGLALPVLSECGRVFGLGTARCVVIIVSQVVEVPTHATDFTGVRYGNGDMDSTGIVVGYKKVEVCHHSDGSGVA